MSSQNQKARFQSNNSTSNGAAAAAIPKGGVSGSKKATGSNTANPSGIAATNVTANAATRSFNNVQVTFQGKIVTPQSLIQKKSYSKGESSYKKNKFVANDQTIDENTTVTADKDKDKAPVGRKRVESIAHGSSASQIAPPDMTRGKSQQSKANKGGRVEEYSIIQLNETPTTMIMSMYSSVVTSDDTKEIKNTEERNTRYEALIKAHANVDGFASRPTQTINNPQKSQNEMAAPHALRDAGCQSNGYDIGDAMKTTVAVSTAEAGGEGASGGGSGSGGSNSSSSGSGTETTITDDMEGLSSSVRKFVIDTAGLALVTPGCLLDTTNVDKVSTATGSGGETTGLKSNKVAAAAPGKGNNKTGKAGDGNYKGQTSGDGGDGRSSSGMFSGSDLNVLAGSSNKKTGGKNNNNINPNLSVSSGNDGDHQQQQNSQQIGQSGSRVHMGGDDSSIPDNDSNGNSSALSFSVEDSEEMLRRAEMDKILSSPLLLKRLAMVERAIQQNANHRSQLDYRDLPDITPITLRTGKKTSDGTDNKKSGGQHGLMGKSSKEGGGRLSLIVGVGANADKDGGLGLGGLLGSRGLGGGGGQEATKPDTAAVKTPLVKKFKDASSSSSSSQKKIRKLFSYSNKALIQGRPVTCMVWNTASADLLAVGYGKLDQIFDAYVPGEALDEMRHGGLVLFWSLRNPDYPEKILRTPHPVTALDFSDENPMMLAVGLNNGEVNVFNVQHEGSNWGVPIETSAGIAGGHSDPVWQLKWIIKGVERVESLVSVSTDGRVLEWNLKKGLVLSTLMQLKKSGAGEGWISNCAAGMCLDFHPLDSSIYVTGTEDGNIHRCSVSYNEQYLETYLGHEGPVYRTKFSPRWPSLFLSCSSDWSMNLYHLKVKAPLLTMRATGENFAINDISWCPDNATVFANITVDAKLQIWDLSVSSIDPVVVVDTNKEDEAAAALEALKAEEQVKEEKRRDGDDDDDEDEDEDFLMRPPNSSSSSNIPTRYSDRFEKETVKEQEVITSPLLKIMKNLSMTDSKKKVLTTVLFGQRNPSVVVGDDRGTVTVYRVFDPVTITHLGPLQQYEKIKKAIFQHTDPASAVALENADAAEEVKF